VREERHTPPVVKCYSNQPKIRSHYSEIDGALIIMEPQSTRMLTLQLSEHLEEGISLRPP